MNTQSTAPRKHRGIADFVMNNVIMISLFLLIVVIAIMEPRFISMRVVRDILIQNSSRMIIACGMTMVLISGGMDLAAGRIVGLAAVVTGSLGQVADASRRFFPNLPQLPLIVRCWRPSPSASSLACSMAWPSPSSPFRPSSSPLAPA